MEQMFVFSRIEKAIEHLVKIKRPCKLLKSARSLKV
jgi:hypothetical protein